MLKKILLSLIFLLSYNPDAKAFELCGELTQGEIIMGHADKDSSIIFEEKKLPVAKNGDFIFALERDAPNDSKISINSKVHTLNIKQKKWDIQNIKGLPQKTVTPSKKDQIEINREYKDVRGALQTSSSDSFWQHGFVQPVEGRVSGNFGGQRIMNGKKKNPHMGTDIAALEGTEVKAASNGIITLADSNYFYSGNVVIIDHGFNLFTIYAHLKNITVKKGDTVKKGQIIGTVGKTGRATGAHLHWGASLNGTRFEPRSLLKINDRNLCSSQKEKNND